MQIEKLKNPYFIVIVAWLATIGLTALTLNSIVAAITVFFTGILPFVLIILWFSTSETGKSIRAYFKKWHVAILFSWFILLYSLYAQKWAATHLNVLFNIDGNNFDITSTLLAVLFTPFGLLYQENIVGSAWTALIIVSMVLGSALPFLLFLTIPFKKILKITGMSFLILTLSSFFLGTIGHLTKNLKVMTKNIALMTDFNENHLCTDEWSKKAQSVIFLGGEKVLAYFPLNQEGNKFIVKSCDYKKTF